MEGSENMKKILYNTKNKEYFKNIRYDIINFIPDGANKILELGCGSGATLIELKQKGKADFVAGIDIIDLGQKNTCDSAIIGDIETMDSLPFQEEFFDVIICADVLEHLVNPWIIVNRLEKYLKNNGIFISSIPNIREIKTMYSIFFRGNFKYVNAGILDKSYLRFFCKKNMIDLFEQNGLKIKNITYKKLRGKRNLLNKLTFGFLEEFLVVQYLIIAKKNERQK